MKNYILAIAVLLSNNVLGQIQTAKPPQSLASGFINMSPGKELCMTREEKEMYNREAIAAKKRWKSKTDSIFRSMSVGRIESTHLPLEWPMRVTSDYDFQYKYFYKGNFVDQNQGHPVQADYSCGGRTYADHDASDVSLWPFWWRMMDNNYVMAVAAAPGIIIEKVDTVYDRRCHGDTFPGSNRIFLLHEDGTTTRYHHLKQGGVTTKGILESVQAGEFLGYVASSGRSSHPHLHFAVYDSSDNLVEPFFVNESCNNYSEESWWIDQHPYWDSKVNRVMTHSSAPTFGHCENEETVFARNNFSPGDQCFVGIAFSEFMNNDQAKDSIFRPDGSLFAHHTINLQYHPTFGYNLNYFYAGFYLPLGNTGVWKIKVDYKGISYYHFFTVGCASDLTVFGSHTGVKGYITGNTLSSTATHNVSSGDKVLYQAPASITFNPGFHAPAGIHLKARLKSCNYAE